MKSSVIKLTTLIVFTNIAIVANGQGTCPLYAGYSLAGDANDFSGNNHHGTVNGTIVTTGHDGSPTNALYFDGVTDRVDLPEAFDFPNRTISLWFKADTFTVAGNNIFSSDNATLQYGMTTMGVKLIDGVNTVGFEVAGNIYSFPVDIQTNRWYHAAIVVGTGYINYYLNYYDSVNIVPQSGGITHSVNGAPYAKLGTTRLNDRNFKGAIDDVRIYDCALSSAEIFQLYNTTGCEETNLFTGGGSDNNFSNPENWCNKTVPLNNHHIIIASGVTMVVDMDYICSQLTIQYGASFNCTGGHTLTLTDAILDGNGNVRVDINSSLIIGSGMEVYNPEPTSGTFIDSRDSHVYKWVKIGTQIWMAENLNYYTSSGSWYYNNDSATYSATYGRLYEWATAMAGTGSSNSSPSGVQGVCPNGWHFPSAAEWTSLTDYLNANGYFGAQSTVLKATSGWFGGGNGTDNYGFKALPGGYRAYISFVTIGNQGYWWSSTENNSSFAFYRAMTYDYTNVYWGDVEKVLGFSVRCVKN